MNVRELKQHLVKENIDEFAYSLTGGLPGDRYVLSEDGDAWSVYYSERGSRWDIKRFQTEDEACTYLLQTLLNDSTTRRKS
jgi:hypothetical protein